MSSSASQSVRQRRQLREVLDECLRRSSAGESIDDQALIAAHPELMPDLASELRLLHMLEHAGRRAREESSTGSDGAARPSSRSAGRPIPLPEIPGYRLLDEIHRGGQGVVFRAVQESTKRTVAVKVQREGPWAGAKDRARFEREVEILAGLRHPNIVTIHDKGSAEGASYFVMDFIDGVPLDRYAEKVEKPNPGAPGRKVEIGELLGMFVRVCDAVHAAHLRGVIHRDLKPSNILVDGAGEPFVLDFGLAKTSHDSLLTTHSLTLSGQFVGSLPWSSPEQAEGRSDAVDVRSDVYSLGVVLYQALVGRFPYDVTGSMREVIERILRAEPARLRKTGASRRVYPGAAPEIVGPPRSQDGGGKPRRSPCIIDADLETIVLRALDKAPERRYQSAGELARDLRHYLAGELIEARRDSGWYVMRKTLRRHRGAVAFAGLVLAGVVAAAVYQGVQSRRFSRLADRERTAHAATQDALRRVETAEHSAEEQRDAALRERETAEAINKFLQDMLAAANPAELGRDVRLDDVLDAAAKKLDAEDFSAPGHVEAAVRTTLGSTWQSLGKWEPAEAQFRRALEVRTGLYGTEHPEVAADMNHLGEVRFLRGNLDGAERIFADVLRLRRKMLPPNHPGIGESLNNVAFVLSERERFDEAEAIYRQALEVWRAAVGEEHLEYILVLDNLAAMVLNRGEYARAEPLCRETYERRLALLGRPDHPDVTTSRNNWAHALWRIGDKDAAEALFRTNLDIQRKQLGELHGHTVATLSSLAFLAHEQSHTDEAEAMIRDVLDREARADRRGGTTWSRAMGNLGFVLSAKGDLGGAEEAYRAALAAHRSRWGEQHGDVATVLNYLGAVRLELGDVEGADDLVCQALAIDQALYGEAGSGWTAIHLHHRGSIYAARSAWPEAEATFQEALAMRERFLGPDHELTVTTREALSRVPRESPAPAFTD